MDAGAKATWTYLCRPVKSIVCTQVRLRDLNTQMRLRDLFKSIIRKIPYAKKNNFINRGSNLLTPATTCGTLDTYQRTKVKTP